MSLRPFHIVANPDDDSAGHDAFRMLVVGDVARWAQDGRVLPQLAGCRFIRLSELTDALLAEYDPMIVLSPLIAQDCDAIKIAEVLVTCGYQGRYRAIAGPLPDLGVVMDEVRSIAPLLDFDVLVIPGKG